jgi:hypothetical protein
MKNDIQIRDTRRAPFCWQEKEIIRILRLFFSENESKGITLNTAFAVYLVLTEIASDKGNISSLEVTQNEIAAKAGISKRQVVKYLELFTRLKIIKTENRKTDNGLNLPNFYTLLSSEMSSLRSETVFQNECTLLKESLEENKKKRELSSDIDPKLLEISFKFHSLVKENRKFHKDFATLSKSSKVVIDGAKTLNQLMTIEKESLENIRQVLHFAVNDNFWKDNLISLSSLRTKSKDGNLKYFTIKNRMERENTNQAGQSNYQQQQTGNLPLPHGFWQKKILNGREVIFCTEMVMAGGKEWREYVFPKDPSKLHKISLEEYEKL